MLVETSLALAEVAKNLNSATGRKMTNNFAQNNYLVIRKAISEELADFCYQYFLNKRMVAKTLLDGGQREALKQYFGSWYDGQVPQTYSHYSDIVMETLLQRVKPVMEAATQLQLVETYSFARIYKKGDTLHRHKDRASCEISTTLNLGGPSWSIFLEPDSSKGGVVNGVYVDGGTPGVEVQLNPGDMLVYRGCDLEHWREPYEYDGCAQVFLHYNNILSPGAEKNRFDGRPHIGLPASFKK
jgi:hypothetical protein